MTQKSSGIKSVSIIGGCSMEDFGWISLHRKIIESEVFANANHLKIWIWMLCKANRKEQYCNIKIGLNESTVLVKRGEFIFGRKKAGVELRLNQSLVYRVIKKFESLQMIVLKSNNHFSIISICNYDTYQSNEKDKRTASEQPANSQRTASEQPANTNNKDNNTNKSNNTRKNAHASEFEITENVVEEISPTVKEQNAGLPIPPALQPPTIEQCRQVAMMSGHDPAYGESYFYLRDADGWCKPRGKGEYMTMIPIANWRSDYANVKNQGYLKLMDDGEKF